MPEVQINLKDLSETSLIDHSVMPFLSKFVHSVIKAREPAIDRSQGGTRV